MPWDDLEDKFTSLVGPRLGAAASAEMFSFIRDLETRENLAPLTQAARG
jgi:hypothetical protein